jgi:phosphoribosylaminoimidazole (AIR) synthetase
LALKDWDWPVAFNEVQKRTGMTRKEMLGTLNCGVGLAVLCSAKDRTAMEKTIRDHGFQFYDLGVVEKNATPLFYPGER